MAEHYTPQNDANAVRRRQARAVITTSDEVKPIPIEGLEVLKGTPSTSSSVLDGGRVSSRTARATARAQERVGKSRRKKRSIAQTLLRGVLGIAVVGAIAAAVYFLVLPRLFGAIGGGDRPEFEQGVETEVVIPDGSGAGEIAEILYQAGIIDDKSAFLMAIKRMNAEQQLKSGPYRFITGANPSEVVRQLMEGPNSDAGILAVPEGLTVAKTADLVEACYGIPHEEFLAQAKASNYVDEFPFLAEAENDSLEGFLFPKTYDLSSALPNVTADMVVCRMTVGSRDSVAYTEEKELPVMALLEFIYHLMKFKH